MLARLVRLVLPLLLLAGTATAAPAPTIAILYFDYAGNAEDMTFLRKGLAQMLVADMAGTPGITVIERARLEEVLAEIDLQRTTKIDRSSAVRVGKLLGARYLVMGSYFDFRDELHVSVTLVEVETGAILAGIRDRRKADAFWDLEQHLAGELRRVLGEKVTAAAPAEPRPTATATKQPRGKDRAGDKGQDKNAMTADKGAEVANKGAEAADKGPTVSARRPAAGAGRALTARTAARYGRALDAMDRGDKRAARAELEAVVALAPDFDMASLDLAKLAK